MIEAKQHPQQPVMFIQLGTLPIVDVVLALLKNQVPNLY